MDEKILVIDDEPEILSFVVELLRAEGFEPESAADSVITAELIQKRQFDLILNDINLILACPTSLASNFSRTLRRFDGAVNDRATARDVRPLAFYHLVRWLSLLFPLMIWNVPSLHLLVDDSLKLSGL